MWAPKERLSALVCQGGCCLSSYVTRQLRQLSYTQQGRALWGKRDWVELLETGIDYKLRFIGTDQFACWVTVRVASFHWFSCLPITLAAIQLYSESCAPCVPNMKFGGGIGLVWCPDHWLLVSDLGTRLGLADETIPMSNCVVLEWKGLFYSLNLTA